MAQGRKPQLDRYTSALIASFVDERFDDELPSRNLTRDEAADLVGLDRYFLAADLIEARS